MKTEVPHGIMPEHVHLLVSEPERATLARAPQAVKQSVARRLIGKQQLFWQARYYDFNVSTRSLVPPGNGQS